MVCNLLRLASLIQKKMTLRLIQVGAYINSLLLFIAECGRNTICLLIHPSKDMWVVSSLWRG